MRFTKYFVVAVIIFLSFFYTQMLYGNNLYEKSYIYDSHHGSFGYIYYPKFEESSNSETFDRKINQIFEIKSWSKNKFGWIEPQEYKNLRIEIDCEIPFVSDDIISSHYFGYSYHSLLRHPVYQSYGITVSMKEGREIALNEWLDLDENFWNLVASNGSFSFGKNRGLETENDLMEHFKVSSRDQLLKRFLGEKDLDYYLTESELVLILLQVHALGDYVEIFLKKEDLQPFFKRKW